MPRGRRDPFAALTLALALAAGAGATGCRGRRAHKSGPSPSPAAAVSSGPSAVPEADRVPEAPPPPAAATEAAPSTEATPSAYADGGAPSGYEHVAVWDLIPTADGAAVLLLDPTKTTVLPIFVGGTEALTIRLDLDGQRHERPLTHDLLASIVRELGGQAVKAQIDDLRDDTYFGSVFVRQGDRVLQLDARPSDAIAIALGSGAPLYVSRSVMLASGVPRESIDKEPKGRDVAVKRTPITL